MSKDERSLIDGFVAELAAVISAMLGAAITPKATNGKGKAAKAADPWVVRVNATGAISKVLAVGVHPRGGGEALRPRDDDGRAIPPTPRSPTR